jgi:hypothetical protein
MAKKPMELEYALWTIYQGFLKLLTENLKVQLCNIIKINYDINQSSKVQQICGIHIADTKGK